MSFKGVLKQRNLKKIAKQMDIAQDYESWQALAKSHDILSGREQWKSKNSTSLYDSAQVQIRYDNLRQVLDENNHSELLYVLNEGIHGNMERMGRPILYVQSKLGTKQLINDYINAIVEALNVIAGSDDIPFNVKVDFFRRASHCYGRSALMMSGGAGLIYFHHGVVQSLIDQGLLPRIISGASAGSWIAAQLGTLSDKELSGGHFLNKVYDIPTGLNPLKVIMGLEKDVTTTSILAQALDEFDTQMTFQEAFEHTGRYINISVAPAQKHQNSRLMNAITSPNVYIRSAIQASSSIPGVSPPVTLYAKGAQGKPKPYLPSRKWFDGSFADDLPAKRLARIYGVNHYIVSLINPLALPFVADPKLKHSRGFTRSVTDLLIDTSHEALLRVEGLMSRYATSVFSPAILMANALIDQEYTGDINIILRKKDYHWRDIMFGYTTEENRKNLVLSGMRSTWPKLSMIKNATLIAQTLSNLLDEMDHQELKGMHSDAKRHLSSPV